MNIAGLQKTTLLDYPGRVAATIFTSSCNMRCPFCHNMDLVTSPVSGYSEREVLDFLAKRAGLLEGVCITGGEPTLWPELPSFIKQIKSLSLDVKLDTNGTNPDMMKMLIDEGLIDYVAMDIKSSLSEYPKVCGVDNIDLDKIKRSVNLLINGSVEYEFRTTMVASFHTMDVMKDIGLFLKGAKNYYLQSFIDSEFVPNHELSAPSKEDLLAMAKMLEEYISNVSLRGID